MHVPIFIFLIVVNISSTYSALALTPGFYRYGYVLPMYNTFEASYVVFFNTSRGTLGQNYAILAALVVLNTCSLDFLSTYIRRHLKEEKPLVFLK